MSFLQPAILIALPLIALPIIIHLINQRRFQTVNWGAMQFLLAANRMSRGYARIRRWLILAARTLAIAGLIFAISRPLSSGWLGVAGGGQIDTTMILLDRSPSMLQRGPSGITKLDSGIDQLVNSLEMLRSSRFVLIDSANLEAIEIDSPGVLAGLADSSAVSGSADIPAMLEVADQYIRTNRPSRCEVWMLSDVRRGDWKDESGRWDTIRASLAELPQMVRFHLLAYPDVPDSNVSIRVTNVRRIEKDDSAQLLLSMLIRRHPGNEETVNVPIQLELDGARSEFIVEITGSELELKNRSIPIDPEKKRGWGRVSIASDASPSDNEFYFLYDEPLARSTLIVAEDASTVGPLELAAAISPNPEIDCTARVIAPDQLITESLDDVALVLWKASLPRDDEPAHVLLQNMLDRGGQVVFIPPSSPTDTVFAGMKWTSWREQPNVAVTTWVGDQGLLSRTRSGASLPVGELRVSRYCELEGTASVLATLDGGAPLLAQATTDRRNVHFLATTTSASDSSLARDGVVLYAMIHRAIADGAASLGNTRQMIAGEVALDSSNWTQLAGNPLALSNMYALHAGVYTDDEMLFSINRSIGEDEFSIVDDDRVASLFDRLDFDRVDDQAGSGASLVSEIWRLFLILMLVALLLEAMLCIPRRSSAVAMNSSGERAAA